MVLWCHTMKLTNYPLANEVAKGYSNASFRPPVRLSHPCEHSRINILQWILTKLGTYLVLTRVWNPIDFQGQRSRSQGLIFRRGDTPRFALTLLYHGITFTWKSRYFMDTALIIKFCNSEIFIILMRVYDIASTENVYCTPLKNSGPSWPCSYGSWIYNYLCNQCLSPLMLWVRIPLKRGVLNTTLCDKVC